jgi:CRP-like cAMP-binding protein
VSESAEAAVTETEPQTACSVDELRQLFLFEKLTEEQLDWLCREGHVLSAQPGMVYTEGDTATCFYVLLSGEVVLLRRVGADDIETVRTTSPGVYGGAFFAYLGDRMPQVYNNSMRVAVPSRFFVLDADKFAHLMIEWFPMATHLLEGLMFGTKSAQEAVGQREKLLALGSLTAGLAHELNNPAAAAVRATATLRTRVAGMRGKLGMIAAKKFEPEVLASLIQLQDEAAERVSKAVALSPMETSDAEDAVADWLDGRGIAGSWVAWTPRGWSWSRRPCPTARWTARCAGSATPSSPSC